jgi:hypothetical protein
MQVLTNAHVELPGELSVGQRLGDLVAVSMQIRHDVRDNARAVLLMGPAILQAN